MVRTSRFRRQTRGFHDIVDVTAEVQGAVRESGLHDGIATVHVPGSTAGVTTLEFEPGLIADLKALFERLAPSGVPYQHDLTWGDGNGFAHVRASLLGPSLSVPFTAGSLLLGTWQQIAVVDFDNRPRQREVIVQLVGE